MSKSLSAFMYGQKKLEKEVKEVEQNSIDGQAHEGSRCEILAGAGSNMHSKIYPCSR